MKVIDAILGSGMLTALMAVMFAVANSVYGG